MKKKWSFLIIVVLTICLVGFTIDRIIPASPVNANNGSSQGIRSDGYSEKEMIAHPPSTQPVVYVVAGLVCILFGAIAVSPLLIDDPAR